MRTEELNDLNSALDPEAIDELFANLGTTKKPSPPQQVAASTNNAPVVAPRRPSSQRQTTRHTGPQNSEGIDWVGWFYKLMIVACFAPLAILLLTSYSWSPFRDHPAAQPIRKMVTERRVVTRDIDKFDVGMRAMGQNPLLEQVGTAHEPDPKTSRKLVITMKKESGRNLFINLLRSLDWIEAFAVEEGETFFLDLPEMGAVGDAYVEAILPCPPIADGPGNVVTGTFAHEADPDTRILSVTFANGAHIKGVTDNHPFFSVDANDFVPVGEMREGDYVKVIDGVTHITNIESRFARPGEMLYNLEIQINMSIRLLLPEFSFTTHVGMIFNVEQGDYLEAEPMPLRRIVIYAHLPTRPTKVHTRKLATVLQNTQAHNAPVVAHSHA